MRPTLLEEISGHNVFKLGQDQGPTTQIADLRLTWKAQGEETGYQFAMYEMTLHPGVGIPLHKHPYAESFYVLQGEVDFARLSDKGEIEWITGKAGESVTAPANAPHTFHNHTGLPAKFLSVSNHYHEVMLKSGGTIAGGDDQNTGHQVRERFAKASVEGQVYVVEV